MRPLQRLSRMLKQIRDVPRFIALGWRDKLLLLEALIHLTAARSVLGVIPFWHIARQLGQPFRDGVGAPADGPMPPGAERIGWAVENMARRTPWINDCLARAIAARFMLKRRRVPSRLYLGRTQDADGKIISHAWLRVGATDLVGASWRGNETFVVLAVYADPPAVTSTSSAAADSPKAPAPGRPSTGSR